MTPTMRLSEGTKLATQLAETRHSLAEPVQRFVSASQQVQLLQKRRTELQSVPFQSRWEAGAELGSIVLAAAAGGLSASLHFSFLTLFGVAFWAYRRSTASIRRRQAAQLELAEVNNLMRAASQVLFEAESKLQSELR